MYTYIFLCVLNSNMFWSATNDFGCGAIPNKYIIIITKTTAESPSEKIIINQNLFKELFQNMNIHYNNNDFFCVNILEDQVLSDATKPRD